MYMFLLLFMYVFSFGPKYVVQFFCPKDMVQGLAEEILWFNLSKTRKLLQTI